MIQSEALGMPVSPPYHEVQGDVELKGLEQNTTLFAAKLNESTTCEGLKHKHTVGSDGSSQSLASEYHTLHSDRMEGIEASDVSNLLEQFLEYEEKQGSLGGCSSSKIPLSSMKDKFPGKETMALKINSFVEAHDRDFVFSHETENDSVNSDVHSPASGETLDVFYLPKKEPLQNGVTKHESSGDNKKCLIDNHSTDHNYACCGYPMRKPPQDTAEIKSFTTLITDLSRPSPQKSVDSDTGNQIDEKASDRTDTISSKRQSSCFRDDADRKSRIPKRYRGPYCEDSSDGECSSSDDDKCYDRRHSSHHGSSDVYNENRRKQHKRKPSYSSDEISCCKRSKRRHSLYSDDSSDDQHYSTSDDDSGKEYRRRYDPRESESFVSQRHSSGSDGNSSSHRRRKRRSVGQDYSERDSHDRGDKSVRDIEMERKLGFKFDQHIKDTANEERRIVYIGKISNKTTQDDIWRRFRPFGPIEKVTVHLREEGDNYAFVTFFEYSSAAEAIERGNEDSRQPVLDICFGGRRKFCGGSYVDFDSNTSYLEEQEVSRPPSSDEMDFDTLLRLSQKNLKDRKESCRGR